MGRTVNRDAVTAAMLAGVASGYAHVGRCSEDEALAEIADVLNRAGARPGTVRARALLSAAGAQYLSPGDERERHWHPEALGLLVAAGADVDLADEIHRQRGTRAGGPLR